MLICFQNGFLPSGQAVKESSSREAGAKGTDSEAFGRK